MSTVKVDTLKTTGDVTVDTIKAWANANDTQTTINDSLNLTSLTDTGTGDCTWNWANNFGSAYYSGAASMESITVAAANQWGLAVMHDARAAGSVRTVDAYAGSATNCTYFDKVSTIHAIGDLA